MLGTSAACALKSRRRKPVQKNPKLPQMKTNPSKRHRDRLNVELDHLTSLLPFSEEVTGHLDKLSVLRLSVGYLKVKSYFNAVFQNNTKSAPLSSANNKDGPSLDGTSFLEEEFLLQALNGFVLVVTADGTMFYASPTIQVFLGYHQSDVVHQSVYELIHADDRDTFRCQLHFALNPQETSSDDAQSSDKALSSSQSLLERSFCCRLRCLLDNTSGFLALNFKGRLKSLLQGQTGAEGNAAPQLALFAIATPVQPPSVMEIRTKTLLFQTKHRLDFAPLGIDSRGKLVLGYTETELVTPGSGYQFIHAADMMYCADVHLRTIKTGESGLAFFRLLSKKRQWLWVQASARVIFKEGRPDFIIVRQKVLTNEEGEEHLRQRKQQIPFNLATGEGVLYDFSVPGPPGSGVPGSGESTTEQPLNPASVLESLLQQDHSVYTHPQEPSPQLQIFSQMEDPNSEQPQPPLEQGSLDSHALLSVPGHIQTARKDLTSEATTDSSEQSLGDIRDGGLDGLEIEEMELRNLEKALVIMNNEEMKYKSRELNQILANDVFLYAGEALERELGGFIQGSGQTGPHISGKIHSLFIEGRRPELSARTSNRSGFAEQIHLGNIPGYLAEPKAVSESPTHTITSSRCGNTQQGHTSLCPLSHSTPQCGNQMIPTQSNVTSQSWLANMHSSHHCVLEVTDSGSRQTNVGPQLQGSSEWKQQQLSQRFLCRSLRAGGINSTAQSFYPQIQPGSCMYEEREGHMLNAAPVTSTQTDPHLEPPCSIASAYVTGNAPHFALSHPGLEVACMHQGVMQLCEPNANMAASADLGNVSLGQLSGGSTGLGTAPSDYSPENGLLQSSLFCWNSGAQIPL
ncbi:aryl hydrocarbon receptor-like isoform X1 [Channa argus]|uniref:aryl hydrocarbon receptor-like isoform X1 n=2 Tax=Channa argus TaxID=215402 RepID=UPI003522A5F6